MKPLFQLGMIFQTSGRFHQSIITRGISLVCRRFSIAVSLSAVGATIKRTIMIVLLRTDNWAPKQPVRLIGEILLIFDTIVLRQHKFEFP